MNWDYMDWINLVGIPSFVVAGVYGAAKYGDLVYRKCRKKTLESVMILRTESPTPDELAKAYSDLRWILPKEQSEWTPLEEGIVFSLEASLNRLITEELKKTLGSAYPYPGWVDIRTQEIPESRLYQLASSFQKNPKL